MHTMTEAAYRDYLKSMQTFSTVIECSMRVSEPKQFPEVNLELAQAPEGYGLADVRSKPLQVSMVVVYACSPTFTVIQISF